MLESLCAASERVVREQVIFKWRSEWRDELEDSRNTEKWLEVWSKREKDDVGEVGRGQIKQGIEGCEEFGLKRVTVVI